jgi:hypothetical protein
VASEGKPNLSQRNSRVSVRIHSSSRCDGDGCADLIQVVDDLNRVGPPTDDTQLADVCFTAGVGRAHLEHRAALVVNSRESAIELLGALADDRPAPGLVRGESHGAPKTALRIIIEEILSTGIEDICVNVVLIGSVPLSTGMSGM